MPMDLTDDEIRVKVLESRIERLQQDLEASEYECFEERQRALVAESIARGVYQKLESALTLEIEGIRDIFEFLPAEAVAPIKERCDRMMKILAEYRE